MREELIKVLNYKLDDINNDIRALTDLDKKIDEKKEESGFVSKILDIFSDNNVMNFAKLDKDDFDKALDDIGDDVKGVFNTDSCNYDGLVYLINGINNGISLTLTDEQNQGIQYFIDKLSEKKKEIDSAIDGYSLVKNRYEINDLDVLNDKKEEFVNVVNDVNDNNYVKNIDLLKEAINFSSLSSEETIDLLTYVLEYNSNLYKDGKEISKEEKKEEPPVEEKEVEEEPEEEKTVEFENDFHFNDIENERLFDLPNVTFDDDEVEETKEEDAVEEENTEEPDIEVENEYAPEYQEYNPVVPDNEETSIPDELTYVPATDEPAGISAYDMEPNATEEPPVEEPAIEESPVEEPVVEDTFQEETNVSEVETPQEEVVEEPKEEIDDDFKDVVEEKTDYEEENVQEEDEKTTSTRELQKIFSKYGIEENVVLNELIDGNVNEYQNILDSMKDNDILDYIKENKELLIESLLYSNTETINQVLKIVRDDLSVDDEDYAITLKIVINTIPSIFVKDGGNYDNFIKNVELFKELGLNLINLFDFSKEVFVADNESIQNNLEVIKKYGFEITYRNAKYLLLIPNIADKLDYYIESVYDDKLKNEKFDGIEYIKEYAAKLNVVTDETIKRLRYSSENGKKVFGSKPGSLSGEITNLRVNALDISSDYMNKFFDNEFANLTGDEVREYVKLVHNSSNVGDYSDELDKLNGYRDGLRYNIDGILVSYNKVVRNYSVLRSYGIDAKKALQFAVCYNLIITKDEYDKLNSLLDKVGGNV